MLIPRSLRAGTLGLGLGLAFLVPAWAQQLPAPSGREVILAYLGSEQEVLRGENALTAVEAALNHLGLIARYVDLEKGYPDEALLARCRGWVSMVYQDDIPGADRLAHWIPPAIAQGKRVALIGAIPFMREARGGEGIGPGVIEAALRAMGLQPFAPAAGRGWQLKALPGAKPWPSFEAGPWREPTSHLPLRALDPRWVLAQTERVDRGERADAVVLGPQVLFVNNVQQLLEQHPFTFKLRWRLDPHALFQQLFQTAQEPAPDPTTSVGRRVFYAHIDGDGGLNVANFPGRPLAAEVVQREIFDRTWLPTTVSFIASEVQKSARLQQAARAIFARPNVEPASHTFTHPFNFEARYVNAHGQTKDTGQDEDGLEREATLERRYGHRAELLNPRHEVDDSVAYLNRFAPRTKPVGLMLWSGRTNPTEAFLERCESLGLPNLNGGDALVDPHRPSIAALAPWARQVGGRLQPYASCANENLFTNLWTGPFDGQAQAKVTFERGGGPRRLAAANVYYHFYAGENRLGLRALQGLYRWAEGQPLAHLWASQYARLVPGFFTATFRPLVGEPGWAALGLGHTRSLRFEEAPRDPDLLRSRGVVGYLRAGRRLWVHMGAEAGELRWREARAVAQPRLAEASAWLQEGEWRPGRLSLRFQAAAPCEAVLEDLPPSLPVEWEGAGWQGAQRAGPDGRLKLRGPRGASLLRVYWRQP